MKKFLSFFLKILPLIAPTTAAVESIVKDAKAGATKKELAMGSLQIATAIDKLVDPGDTESINAANQLASITIDSTVALQNALAGK